ncbi:hypothetical protein ncot_10225 [Nocardioides sp. JQ2195]|uniref:hypothetical protein n=1 Tax=Nocardioides sp. JQ2195 TaxID=2592334 RepID=UPI00143EF3FB|nr:hypothetical protein [Nocardioides sp. JQ2195]QIX26936.1 hypothetical protein ncot_10225 [Nocardioides sp. JQ2195]
MPKYLAEAEIRHAVEQLERSSARQRMCEFLIALRTLKLAGTQQVAVAESVSDYVQAVNELTNWASPDDVDKPYFNPFGSEAAFKGPKFPSNGPSNTMHGWATQADSPLEIIQKTRPKSIARRPISEAQLCTFLLKRAGGLEPPRLIDIAVWFFRSTDLEGQGGSLPTRVELEAMVAEEIGLTDEDVAALFRLEADDTDADQPDVAEASGEDTDAEAETLL